jgi:hypothetical protein
VARFVPRYDARIVERVPLAAGLLLFAQSRSERNSGAGLSRKAAVTAERGEDQCNCAWHEEESALPSQKDAYRQQADRKSEAKGLR